MQDGRMGEAHAAGGPSGPPMFWSQTSVDGRPRVLVLDASGNRDGWETESCARISNSLLRRDISVVGGGPVRVNSPAEVEPTVHPHDRYNCVFLCARADGTRGVGRYWAALRSSLRGTRKLLAVCTWEGYDAVTTDEVLTADGTFAVLAVSQLSPLSVRAAGRFFMKFFAELDMHSESSESMTGKMVWFGHSKAREILRRRNYAGKAALKS